MIDVLFKIKAETNLQDGMGDTALYKSIIEKLLQAGADPTIKNKKGFTPATVAIHWDEPDIAAVLIKSEFPKPEGQLKALQQIATFST